MHRRAWLGLPVSCALLLGAGTFACDVGKSDLYETSGGSAASAGSTGAATNCSRSSDCTDQVCSPDGRCVDCYDASDCRANQHCDAEHCVADGMATGGSGTGGGTTTTGGSDGSDDTSGTGDTGLPAAACSDAQVLFVIQRSGAMFEEPSADANYWSMVRDAITGADGALADYADKLAVGALFFVRLQPARDPACPVLSSAAPQTAALMPLQDLFTSNQSAYSALAEEDAKMDAPVPEAVTKAAEMLSGSARHLVLITTAVPDTCTLADSNCTVDAAIEAVQSASSRGVTTHVIGLGNTDNLNAGDDHDGYATYLSQLANAGAGKPVAMSAVFERDCSDSHDVAAAYSDTSGDAHAYRAETASDVKSALQEILAGICP